MNKIMCLNDYNVTMVWFECVHACNYAHDTSVLIDYCCESGSCGLKMKLFSGFDGLL